MTLKQIYREAARQIAEGESSCCCWAINGISRVDFLRIFKPYDYITGFFYGNVTPENQLARSLALLIMAEMEG